MNYLNQTIQWEEYFIQEAVELEEIMKTLDVESLNKSKLRICLENNILGWEQYQNWFMSQVGCCGLKSSVAEADLEEFIDSAKAAQDLYSSHEFWNEDLLPLLTWDEQLVVIGLQYNENLITLENHIFILAPPHVLTFFASKVMEEKIVQTESQKTNNENAVSESDSSLEGINFDTSAPKLVFNASEMIISVSKKALKPTAVKVEIVPEPLLIDIASEIAPVIANVTLATPAPETKPEIDSLAGTSTSFLPLVKNESVWDFITDRHGEYSFEIKKQFDGFVVLKIEQNKTQVFKMDRELTDSGVNPMLFEYLLTSNCPFKNVFESGQSGFFTIDQLNMKLQGFEHACISPLKRGAETVGFFVGFKKQKLSVKDQILLDELARESAS